MTDDERRGKEMILLVLVAAQSILGDNLFIQRHFFIAVHTEKPFPCQPWARSGTFPVAAAAV